MSIFDDPQHGPNPWDIPQPTIAPTFTMRDWFAGQAIGAIIRSMASGDYKAPPEGMTGAQKLAEDAYYTADAMLAAREQQA